MKEKKESKKQTFITCIRGAYFESLFAGGGEQFIIASKLSNKREKDI